MKRSMRLGLAGCALVCLLTVAACNQMNDEAARAALKAADIAEINNVMSLHSWYHAAMQNDVEVQKIWSKRPDIILARNSGYWKGDSVRKLYGEKVTGMTFTIGAFVWHPVTTGVVEVAEDRQTAKGVWYTPGAGGHQSANGSKSLDWMWEKYGVDFVREDGHWKVWHMKVYTDWSGGANISEHGGGPPPSGSGPPGGMGAPPMGGPPPNPGVMGAPPASGKDKKKAGNTGQPGGPSNDPEVQAAKNAGSGMPASMSTPDDVLYKNPYKEWSGTAAPKWVPRPPEPYKTFSETWSYADEDQ